MHDRTRPAFDVYRAVSPTWALNGARAVLTQIKDLGWVLVLVVAGSLGAVKASTAEPFEFDGHVEAVQHADVYSRAEGIVDEIYISQGEYVDEGALLVRLKSDLDQLNAAVATAELARAEALLRKARGKLERAERLSSSGSASEVTLLDARTELALAESERDLAQHARDLAQTRYDDTFIRAPISGYVEDPRVRIGSLVEFNSGDPPLFQILELSPIRVVYEVPYVDRLSHVAQAGTNDPARILDTVALDVFAQDGRLLKSGINPTASATWVDPETGTIRVWATVGNTDGSLLPGMRIKVRSATLESNSTEVPRD